LDSKGRPTEPDFSANGLGSQIVRFIPYSSAIQQQKSKIKPPLVSDSETKFAQAIGARYEQKFGKGANLFFVLDGNLQDLEFEVQSRNPGKSAFVLVSDGDSVYETTISPPARSLISSVIKVDSSQDIKRGISLQNRTNSNVNASVTHMQVFGTQKARLETIDESVPANSMIQARIDGSRGLALSYPGRESKVKRKVSRKRIQEIDALGKVRELSPQPEPPDRKNLNKGRGRKKGG
jgi:hypothetical protein